MMQFLEFTFRSGWTFFGMFILIYTILYGILRALLLIRVNSLFKVRRERELLGAALKELVKLKDHKILIGKDSIYETKQPIAWNQAREVLRKCGIFG